MNYDLVMELDDITLNDCIDLYENENISVIINDGRINNFTKEQ